MKGICRAYKAMTNVANPVRPKTSHQHGGKCGGFGPGWNRRSVDWRGLQLDLHVMIEQM